MPDTQPTTQAQALAAAAIADINEEKQRRKRLAAAVQDTESLELVDPEAGEGKPWDDFNRRATAQGELRYLEGHGWLCDGEDCTRYRLTRPGKKDGCSATLTKSSPPILYVFSSEAGPFDSNKGYTPFAIRAFLEHGGDFSATAKALVQQGFGEQRKNRNGDGRAKEPARRGQDLPPGTEAPPSQQHRAGFEFVHNAEILADLRPVEWRIRDILTDYSFYYNFGDPGHFKTFVELDRLLCIAAGLDYHGHKVKQGTVFYICGEGQQGIGRRIAAWHIAHGTKAEDVPFFVSKTPTQLMDLAAVEDVRWAVDAMAKRYGPAAVVHIDTLARNFGEGDENATKDMNAAISNLDRAFGAEFCRGLTHHTGHGNKDRARGSIALHGAADAAFRVSLTDVGQIIVEGKKAKDAPTPTVMVFDRREVLLQIGDVEDRSYVLKLAAEGEHALRLVKPKKAAELKGGMQKALDTLRRLYSRYGENLRKGGRPGAVPLVTYVDWRTACIDAGLYKRTDNFRTAAEKLHLDGLIKYDESRKFVYPYEITTENEN